MSRVEQSYKEHAASIDRNGKYTKFEIPYIVFDAEDEESALSAVLAETPSSCHDLPLESIDIDTRENDTTFKLNAVYKTSGGSSGGDFADDSSTVSFDCGGGTRHITHALSAERIAYGTKKAGNAIGWNGKVGPEMEIVGVDVPTAQLRETYTKRMRLSRITSEFKRNVAALVGKVNADMFKGWSPGEVMFLGMSYSCPESGATMATVTFNFSVQPNESKAKVSGHEVSKKGFEYAWALSETKIDPQTNLPKVDTEAIYVDQVCEYAKFKTLGL